MMLLDILLVLLIVVIIALTAMEGLVRSAFMLFSFYLLTILVGMLIAGLNLAQALADAVISSLGTGPTTPSFYQGIMFIGVLIVAWIITVVMIRMGLRDTSIQMLGWGDNVLGTLLGFVLALALAAVVCNSWGVIVADRWQPDRIWLPMRVAFESSAVRPFMMRVLLVYRRALFPFAGTGYPVFFIPQG
ncbi:MAG: CvpA family protein [Anaerolineae bacterium]|nr:CvpA family protein [Anaerolineae bacterium]